MTVNVSIFYQADRGARTRYAVVVSLLGVPTSGVPVLRVAEGGSASQALCSRPTQRINES